MSFGFEISFVISSVRELGYGSQIGYAIAYVVGKRGKKGSFVGVQSERV